MAEPLGIPVWCQDEAGPYQAIPQPGATWAPTGKAACQPHEYLRGGTAKLLTLFRPATGEVRARGVRSAPNSILHPWLQEELTQILQASTPPPVPVASAPFIPCWWERRQDPALRYTDPPLRLILILDNLAGHKSSDLVRWLCNQGILPLYTPLSGSWLNMAESVQRILVRRALAGAHPASPEEIITWLEQTIHHWNRMPTPFVWDGKRRQRRVRARQRRLGGSQAATAYGHLIAA